jgi:hypothetical protein
MKKKLRQMPSRRPPTVFPRADDTPAPPFVGGKASVAPVGATLLRDRDVRRHLRGRRRTAEMSALARLCMEELNEQCAAVVDRGDFCLHVGRRVLRRLGI